MRSIHHGSLAALAGLRLGCSTTVAAMVKRLTDCSLPLPRSQTGSPRWIRRAPPIFADERVRAACAFFSLLFRCDEPSQTPLPATHYGGGSWSSVPPTWDDASIPIRDSSGSEEKYDNSGFKCVRTHRSCTYVKNPDVWPCVPGASLFFPAAGFPNPWLRVWGCKKPPATRTGDRQTHGRKRKKIDHDEPMSHRDCTRK